MAGTRRSIFRLWAPLASTWLMMSVEGPYLAAVIARLPDPTPNLAAYGVAIAVALIVEAPVIMIMSASTKLVSDTVSFHRLRNFTYALNAAATASLVLLLATPAFSLLADGLMDLPAGVTERTRMALWVLLPWPAAIGYRRFYQGLLIRAGKTRLIAYGTVTRLVAMSGAALWLALGTDVAGAVVGAAALSAGVSAEAIASRMMAARTVVELRERAVLPEVDPLGYSGIARFYYPLALTSLIALAVHPMLTFFMGRGQFPVESLAVYPVVLSLSFIFRSLGFSYQEVVIAVIGDEPERLDEVRRFALKLGLATSTGLALIGFTPLADLWFEGVSGLDDRLAQFAVTPTRIVAIVPLMSVWMSFQRGVLVDRHRTRPITLGTVLEVATISILLIAFMGTLEWPAVVVAVAAFVAGRILGVLYLERAARAASAEIVRSAAPQP